jgi:transposase-like protein
MAKRPKKAKIVKKKKLTTSKIICIKCKETKKTTKPQVQKLISLFGSLEEVHNSYHCIKCRKEFNVRKDGKPKPPKREYKKKPNYDNGLPEWMRNDLRKNAVCGPWTTWEKPAGVTQEKWRSAIKGAVNKGLKEGYLTGGIVIKKKR